jgi:hypothetical protein
MCTHLEDHTLRAILISTPNDTSQKCLPWYYFFEYEDCILNRKTKKGKHPNKNIP